MHMFDRKYIGKVCKIKYTKVEQSVPSPNYYLQSFDTIKLITDLDCHIGGWYYITEPKEEIQCESIMTLEVISEIEAMLFKLENDL